MTQSRSLTVAVSRPATGLSRQDWHPQTPRTPTTRIGRRQMYKWCFPMATATSLPEPPNIYNAYIRINLICNLTFLKTPISQSDSVLANWFFRQIEKEKATCSSSWHIERKTSRVTVRGSLDRVPLGWGGKSSRADRVKHFEAGLCC